jgi:hypothetical protein
MSHSIQRFRRQTVCALVAAAVLAASPAAFSADKPKEQQISHGIAKEMTDAQKALQASKWQEALKDLDAAEAKGGSNLTPFDKKTIYDFKGFAHIKLNQLKEAEAAYETAIGTGQYNADESLKIKKMLFQISASNQQFPKALEYGKTLSDAGSFGSNDYVIMEQIYYQQKDCKNAEVWADKAIAAAKKANEQPKELVYQIKLQCAADNGDSAAQITGLYDLIRATNKTQYWNTLLRLTLNQKLKDHDVLMVLRIMYDTGSMTDDGPYIEMAQLLGDAALPGEAVMVLTKGQSSGAIKDEHKERVGRLLTSLQGRADSDKKSLPQQDAEAAKAKSGETYVKVGEVYFGAADYQGAVTAINKGMQAGSVKSQDEAYVYLGRSQVQLKNNADAKKAFDGLKGAQGVNPDVQKLWALYAEKLGTAAQ